MKKFRKAISINLSLLLAFVLFHPVSASNEADAVDNHYVLTAASLLSSAIQDHNLDLPSSEEYTLGAQIPAYKLTENSIQPFNDAKYYIVYGDQQPIGIFTVNGANTSEPTYSFGKDFVDKLADAKQDIGVAFSLVVTDRQIFAVNESSAIEVESYDVGGLLPIKTTREIGKSESGDIEIEVEHSESKARRSTSTISTADVNTAVSGKSLLTLDDNIRTTINLPPQVRVRHEVSGDVPAYTQASNSNYCWAVSAWCVGE